MISFHLMLAALLGCLDREQCEMIRFLREENRVKAQLQGQRLRLTDDRRRRAVRTKPLGAADATREMRSNRFG